MLALPHKPFTYTGKGTARRQAIINDYAAEIDALYKANESTTHTELQPPAEWSEAGTRAFVRSVVHKALGRFVDDGADVFQFGCDRCVGHSSECYALADCVLVGV